MYAIETRDLTKSYGSLTAVDHLNLAVEEGELVTLLGVNGAGKSTTVRMLSTLTAPSSGDALILGHSLVKEGDAVRRLIALSPQESPLAPNLTVKENLELMAGLHGFSRGRTARKLDEMRECFRFDANWLRRAGKLSGGWQRRLSIAMALICEPKILFLDEPTLGLDVLARRELWETIRSLKGKVTVILTTHLMPEAEALSDRVAVMHAGRLIELGTPRELCEAHGTDNLEDAFLSILGEEAR